MDKNIDKRHYYRSYARVNLACIRNNFDELKKLLAPKTKTMAVVKADGYGHGSVAVAKTLEDRADYFAVADIAEAVELRNNEIKLPGAVRVAIFGIISRHTEKILRIEEVKNIVGCHTVIGIGYKDAYLLRFVLSVRKIFLISNNIVIHPSRLRYIL